MRTTSGSIIRTIDSLALARRGALTLLIIMAWSMPACDPPTETVPLGARHWRPPPGLLPFDERPLPECLSAGLGYYNAGDIPLAVELLSDCHRRHPDDIWVSRYYAISLLASERPEDAIGILETAAERAPRSSGLDWYYALALAKSGDEAAAREALLALTRRGDAWARQARRLLDDTTGKVDWRPVPAKGIGRAFDRHDHSGPGDLEQPHQNQLLRAPGE